MAGTMPHAVFVETDLPFGGVAAYAAELPGCAVFAQTDTDAVAAIPQRVSRFGEWLRSAGEAAPHFEGGSWYEVERAAAGGGRRAAFSLDALPPSDEEMARWLRWLELAREELADALDAATPEAAAGALADLARQDRELARELGTPDDERGGDPIDELYAARDALTDALLAAGADGNEVRRVLRIAIADDLRVAEQLRTAAAS
jgi:hypothetical protein